VRTVHGGSDPQACGPNPNPNPNPDPNPNPNPDPNPNPNPNPDLNPDLNPNPNPDPNPDPNPNSNPNPNLSQVGQILEPVDRSPAGVAGLRAGDELVALGPLRTLAPRPLEP
jgi:hypothetical protein